MAITPNVSAETLNKEWVRANSANGANSYTGNPMPVANAIPSGGIVQLWALDLTGTETVSFTSEVTGLVATLDSTSTSTEAALALGAIVGNGTTVVLENAEGVYLKNTTTRFAFLNNTGLSIDVPIDAFGLRNGSAISGTTTPLYGANTNLPANLTGVTYTAVISGTASVVSGTLSTNGSAVVSLDVAAATDITDITAAYTSTSGTGTVSWTLLVAPETGDLAQTYPSYVGAPYAAPTWVDDATVHAYEISGNGSVIQDTTRVVQKQVRQLNTGEGPDGGLETQQWDAYFAVYQSNLNQTQQKNTKQQQC